MKSTVNLTMNKRILLVSIATLVFVGCKPASKTGIRSYNNQGTSQIYNNQTTGTSTPYQQSYCVNASQSIGTIYDSNLSSTAFENQVKSFLTAVVVPSDIGTISSSPSDASTGLRFTGVLKINQSGQVELSQSNINIKVYDSISAQGKDPIPVNINGASAGQFNLQTGVGYVIFKDNYGEIRLDGQLNSQSFSGQMTYKNYKTVLPNTSPSSGTLGQFYTTSCGFVQMGTM